MGDTGSFFWVEEVTGEPYVPPVVGMKRKARTTKKMEFVGWGSRPLIEFLQSIDVDTSKQISQYDVTDIVNKYIKEHNLNHPTKKKRILSDECLLSLFGRKTIAKNKIYELLGTHFAENQEDSDDDLFLSSEEDAGGTSEKQKNVTSERKTYTKKKVLEAPKSCFAAIIPDNIKLIYLRRSLIKNLLKDPEAFERKIVGSFVRVKSDPHDYLQKNSHMLVQVTGLKKASDSDDKSAEIILQVSNFMKDVNISMLSDENFTEEECKDLHQRIKDGLLKKPTLVDLEEKVQLLHEDVTNHWLVMELALLQKLIDRANEKGWRRELFEYLERRRLLQTPDEQSRLLRDVPEVIAEEIETEAEPTPQHFPDNLEKVNDCSPELALNGVGESTLNGGSNVLKYDGAAKGTLSTWISFSADSAGNEPALAARTQTNEMDYRLDALLKEEEKQPTDNCHDLREEERQPTENCIESNSKIECVNVQKNFQGPKDVQVIDLSDDEEIEDTVDDNCILDNDIGSYKWHYADPRGDVQGPFSVISLKRWSDADYFPPNFKVWMTGQCQEEAVLLSEILHRYFSN